MVRVAAADGLPEVAEEAATRLRAALAALTAGAPAG